MKRELFSIEAEQCVLGSAMLNTKIVDSLSDIITARDFSDRRHSIIWGAICDLTGKGKPADPVVLSELLDSRGQIEIVGGMSYMADISLNTPAASHAEAYAGIVHELAQKRRLLASLEEISDEVNSSDSQASMLIDQAQGKLLGLVGKDSSKAGFIGDFLKATLDMVDARYNDQESAMGLSFGLDDLDEMTMGMKAKQLIIIAGRPSMGKTAFMLNIVRKASVVEKRKGLIFSLEMGSDAITNRLVASSGNLELQSIYNPKHHMDGGDWGKFSSAVSQLKDAPLVIDDRSGLTPSQIRGAAKRWKERMGGLDYIAIDYLGLMRSDGKHGSREQEVAEMSRSMKELAKEMNCPVILLSQLNRSLEQRPNKRPMMSDLRESGAIEQDADLILFPYRDEVYNKDNPENKGIAEIIIGKQREGSLGTAYAAAMLSKAQFNNLDENTIRSLREKRNQPASPKPRAKSAAEMM